MNGQISSKTDLEPAPFHAEVARAPATRCFRVQASDGVGLRLALWGEGERGTVLLFPGRSECVEKYGITAGALAERGFATLAIDWRGQGLSDRVGRDPRMGHVGRFAHYQRDVAAMLAASCLLDLPGPLWLLSHSMGGAIGLRALIEGLPVKGAVFCAPMWGLNLHPAARPIAWALGGAAHLLGFDQTYAPGTGPGLYLEQARAEDNVLTTDPEMFAYMRRQVVEHPELGLGGPSLGWVWEALTETRALRAAVLPAASALVVLGSRERVVQVKAVPALVERWATARLEIFEGAVHEVLMEGPAMRSRFLDRIAEQFTA